MILIPVQSKTIDGKKWKGNDVGYPLKKNAKTTAIYLRSHGKYARIIKEKSYRHGNYYNVYSRSK